MQNYTHLQETISKLFVEMDYFIAIASFIILVIISIVTIVNYFRTKRFQDYDYSTRLQILDEQLTCGSPSLKDIPALSYQAKIKNCGLKTIKIDHLYMDYGDKIDSNKRMKRHIDGEQYLSPEKWHEFGIEISWVDVEQMKKRFNINQCFFFIRVAYHTPDGSIQENIRSLGDTRTIIIQKGVCLT